MLFYSILAIYLYENPETDLVDILSMQTYRDQKWAGWSHSPYSYADRVWTFYFSMTDDMCLDYNDMTRWYGRYQELLSLPWVWVRF